MLLLSPFPANSPPPTDDLSRWLLRRNERATVIATRYRLSPLLSLSLSLVPLDFHPDPSKREAEDQENSRERERGKVSFPVGGAGDKYRFHLDPIAIERKQTPGRAALGLGSAPTTTDYSAPSLSLLLLLPFVRRLLRLAAPGYGVFAGRGLTLVLCSFFSRPRERRNSSSLENCSIVWFSPSAPPLVPGKSLRDDCGINEYS